MTARQGRYGKGDLMKLIRKSELTEGTWRNGKGLRWDIAAEPPGTEHSGHFGWLFGVARIDADVPFSSFPDVERIFTLIEGNGLDLQFEGHPSLAVHDPFVPHPHPCNAPTFCHLRDGPCLTLNLFTRRGHWAARADVHSGRAEIVHPGAILLFALQGEATVNGLALNPGDAAIASDAVTVQTEGFVFAARMTRED